MCDDLLCAISEREGGACGVIIFWEQLSVVITYIGSISVDSASYEHNSRGRGPGGVPVARILEVVGGDPWAVGELET